MYLKYTILILLLLQTAVASAQSNDVATECASRKHIVTTTGAKTTATIPETNDYDIKHVKFDIAMDNRSSNMSGVVTTTAKVVAATMPVYAFELDSALKIDSVKINNVACPVLSTDSIRKVTLGTILTSGATFTASVWYHGASKPGKGNYFTEGLQVVTTSPDSFRIMYSFSDKDNASDWWPCKQNIQDKIDSVDMWVTVADTLKVGSNGLLKNITTVPGNKLRYEWKTKYPIDYYLISVAVAPYNEYSYYMHYTDGTGDSMLIQNYVYNTPGHFTPTAKAVLDSTGLIVDYFSTLFGRYPFDKEKYGHSMGPLGGGMEHQTMTTMGTGAYESTTLIAHELGHQWWGNHVTYGSWRDIWLSEGFASYCEQLFMEHYKSAQESFDYRVDVMNSALDPSKSVYVDDTTSTGRIFWTATTYKKGGMVAHMLRYIAPNDNVYFTALRKYQQQYSHSYAFTSDFQNLLEQEYGTDLDSFFRQWVYGAGYPIYRANWFQDNTTKMVGIQLIQATANPSVACFWMPVEVKLKTTAGDRIVKLEMRYNSITNFIYCDSTVTGLEIDPNSHIVRRLGLIKKDPAVMSVNNILAKEINVAPNPTNDNWILKNVPQHATLQLTDISGKVVWSSVETDTVNIPATNLAKGNYLLTITVDNKSGYKRLVKN